MREMLKFESEGKPCEFQRDSVKVSEALSELGLLKKALAGKVNGELLDLDREVFSDPEGGSSFSIEPVLANSEEGLEILRHSTAHLMAQAVEKLYPGAKFGIGPCIKDGFYYDIDLPVSLTDQDLPAIEEEMRKLAGSGGMKIGRAHV
jgi:threonyl-tRNA synthetase